MKEALGYRLATSGGPLSALALAVLHVSVVLQSSNVWRGDGLWAVQRLGSGILIALPVILVLFAIPPVLRGGARADENLLPSRPWQARIARFGVDVGTVVGLHLAFVAPVLVWTRANGDNGPWGPIALTLAAQLLAIAALGVIGRAIGEVGKHPAVILVAALLGTLVAGFAADALRVSAGNSPYAGLEIEPGDYVVAGVAMLVVAAAVLLRPAVARYGGLVVAGAALVVLVCGQTLGEPVLRPSGAGPTDCRSASDVSVCVFPGYSFMADDLNAPVKEALAALERNGVDPRLRRVEQSVPGNVEEPGVVSIPFDEPSLEADELSSSIIIATVLHPSWCPRINSPEPLPAAFDAAQRNSYHWLEHAMGLVSDRDYEFAVPRFAALPPPVQQQQVQDFLDRNSTCEGLT